MRILSSCLFVLKWSSLGKCNVHKKQKTNKQQIKHPSPYKTCLCFVWISCRIHRFHSLDVLFEEKRREIWLSSMKNITHWGRPVRCITCKHVTKLNKGQLVCYIDHHNGLVNRFTDPIIPTFEGAGGRRGEGWGRLEKNLGKTGGSGKMENLHARRVGFNKFLRY